MKHPLLTKLPLITQHPLVAAAQKLSAILVAENAALAKMDLPGASQLLQQKTAATEELAAAQALAGSQPKIAAPAGLLQAATELERAAQENRKLLTRAMTVQSRVLGFLAQAAKTADAAPQYGHSGRMTVRPTSSAWALRAQA